MNSRITPVGRHAFTMIELVVVMLILATLASLVAFSLRGVVNRYQMNGSVRCQMYLFVRQVV